ncbi:MAG: hypothetical protein AAFZ92_03605 [Pseudomonadota bacterium]
MDNIPAHWTRHCENTYYRHDTVYAGKDHTKNNKTFICISNESEERTGFKTLMSAMKYADTHWPQKTLPDEKI